MKNSLFLFLAAALASTAALSGCSKEAVSAPGKNLKISLQMKRSPVTISQHMRTMASVVFNSGYVIVREVVFDADRTNGPSVSISEEKITTIDLATGVANPPFLMDIPAGTYKNISLGIEIQDENDKPSVVAEGVYTSDAGVATPIRFEFNSGEVFEAEAAGPVTLAQETPATAKISFDPHVWFSSLTKTQLDRATRYNGVIIISETKNTGLFDIVADKLDDATEAVFQ